MKYNELLKSLKIGQRISVTGTIVIVLSGDNVDALYFLKNSDGELLSFPDLLKSSPPLEKCKVTNLWVDPLTGKLTVEYDDTPVK